VRQYKFKKINKISFKADYPCPCRRNGCLKPIFLTEALGCDRCQQIFVVQDNHQVIEQLSSVYQKRAWRWNGHRWINIYPGLSPNSLSLLFIAIVLSPIILAIALPLILHRLSAPSTILWVVLCLVLLALVGLVLWLAYRP
jgi:hypothetical protein